MKIKDLRIGMQVYHRFIYNYCEPMVIVGIKEGKVELEGDYSGGTYPSKSKSWYPVNGLSNIYNYGYKEECRASALTIEKLMCNVNTYESNEIQVIAELTAMVLGLTRDIEWNPEIITDEK
jgi:hypothetical protein